MTQLSSVPPLSSYLGVGVCSRLCSELIKVAVVCLVKWILFVCPQNLNLDLF